MWRLGRCQVEVGCCPERSRQLPGHSCCHDKTNACENARNAAALKLAALSNRFHLRSLTCCGTLFTPRRLARTAGGNRATAAWLTTTPTWLRSLHFTWPSPWTKQRLLNAHLSILMWLQLYGKLLLRTRCLWTASLQSFTACVACHWRRTLLRCASWSEQGGLGAHMQSVCGAWVGMWQPIAKGLLAQVPVPPASPARRPRRQLPRGRALFKECRRRQRQWPKPGRAWR